MKKFYSILIMLVICAALLLSCESSPKTFTVTLNSNYSGGETKTETAYSDTVYSPNWTPERTGYHFHGWCYDKEGTKPYSSTVLTSNTTLYADWEKEPAIVSISVECDLSKLTISKSDVIKCTATYKNGSFYGEDSKKETMEKDGESLAVFSLSVKEGSGSVEAEVWHDGKTIGKGSTTVSAYSDGATYTITVKPVN